jgi:nicotine blue oxidoreductase
VDLGVVDLGAVDAGAVDAAGVPALGAAEAEAPGAARHGVVVVHNPDWRTGMGSSLRAGLAALPSASAAAVIALVDQPLVSAEAVHRLISAFVDGAEVAVASYAGQPRNPVLIARRHWAAAAAAAVGDAGARPFLRAHPGLVTKVECADTGRPDDLDTEDDLRRITRLVLQSDAGARAQA